MHISIERGNYELACIIIALKQNLDQKDYQGRTALHYGVLKEKRKVVKYLLLKGANKYIKDNQGDTPENLNIGNSSIQKLLVTFK